MNRFSKRGQMCDNTFLNLEKLDDPPVQPTTIKGLEKSVCITHNF